MQLRETQSLCYSIGSSVDKFKGIMLVDAGIDFDQYQTALDGIYEQLDLCKQGQITTQELESARLYLLNGLRTAMDSPGRLDDFAVGQAAAGLTGTIEDTFRAVESLTLEDVVEAANAIVPDTVYFLRGVEETC
jgi:predicted Zn-dependent peptidase